MNKDKQSNEVDQFKNRKNNNEGKNQLSIQNIKKDKVCWKWINLKCEKGKNCIFDHPKMCNAKIKNEKCRENPCDLYHPLLCWANSNQKICKWGEICKFRHTYENTQRNGF